MNNNSYKDIEIVLGTQRKIINNLSNLAEEIIRLRQDINNIDEINSFVEYICKNMCTDIHEMEYLLMKNVN